MMSSAGAAGLGKLTVLSSLGQPLNAEIELTSVMSDEVGTLTVKLASAEAFRQANIELNPSLLALRFAVEQRNGRQVVHVTSAQPINDPFVDMLLEVGGVTGKLVREYTFLLDPAEMRRPQAPMLAPAAPAVAVAPARTAPASTASAAAPAATPVTPAPATPAGNAARRNAGARAAAVAANAAAPAGAGGAPAGRTSGEGYKVKKGDTLAAIAGQYKSDGVSLDQMLVAMQRSNPDAFLGNNINRLRSGQVLTVPDRAAATSIAAPEARRIVVAQLADFNGYKNRLAAQVAGKPSGTGETTRQGASGKVTAKIEETPTAANEARDKLKLSKSGSTAPEKTAAAGLSSEERIAADKALADANARVAALEKNVGELQNLLEMKNKDMAERQSQAAGVKPTTPATALTPTPASTSATPAGSAATPAAPAADTPAQATAETPANPAAVVAPAPAPAADTTAKMPAVVPAPVPVAEPSLGGRLLGSPLLLGLIAIAVAAAGAVGLRRYGAGRKKNLITDDGTELGNSTSLKANSIFAATGGQSVDTSNSVFNSNFAPSATQLDTNEVDPVAEADVYIAYGRDAQAEEILKEALRTQPERNAVRLKLLEIYASRPDLRVFELAATELHNRTNGEGDDWQQAAKLGYGIDPANPLYAAGRSDVAALDTGNADDLDLDALLNTTRTDAAAKDLSTQGDGAAGKAGSDAGVPLLGNSAVATPDMPAGVSSASWATSATGDGEQAGSSKETGKSGDGHALDFKAAADADADKPDAGKAAALADVPTLEDSGKFDLDDLDFELPPTTASTVSTASTSAVDGKAGNASASDFDIPEIDDVLPPASAAATGKTPEAKDLELSNIDLNLDPQATGTASTGATGDAVNAAEMATKLDLALAYQEIGD
ncbi:MAG: type IV pilus assembly protein FimV, partial [Janthinobacterium lividum]